MEDVLYEIEDSANTNLFYSGIDIVDYKKENDKEILTVDFCWTTTGNLITYLLDNKTGKITIVNYLCYSPKDPKTFKGPMVDEKTIDKLFAVARKMNIPFVKKIEIKRF